MLLTNFVIFRMNNFPSSVFCFFRQSYSLSLFVCLFVCLSVCVSLPYPTPPFFLVHNHIFSTFCMHRSGLRKSTKMVSVITSELTVTNLPGNCQRCVHGHHGSRLAYIYYLQLYVLHSRNVHLMGCNGIAWVSFGALARILHVFMTGMLGYIYILAERKPC